MLPHNAMNAEALCDRSPSQSDAENWLALGAGALLLLAGASRRSAIGACLAVSSAPLLYRGITIKPGDTVAVWGCGPVGQFAIKSAYLLGAERVIAIDRFAERLALASSQGRAETLNYEDVDVLDALRHMTGGQGPDACIDAVGLEAHGTTLDAWYDRAKTSMFLATDRPHALRQAISACRKGGTVSIPGVYGGWLDKFPLGAAFAKGLTLKMGQTHMHKYMPILLERIERGEIDPSVIITHRIGLEDAPAMYRTFRDKDDSCIKVVITPGAAAHTAKHRHSDRETDPPRV
jgi:threonine dehydrogenase-like Zn-dependent dehydrogenase